jgi:hypothetical protein
MTRNSEIFRSDQYSSPMTKGNHFYYGKYGRYDHRTHQGIASFDIETNTLENNTNMKIQTLADTQDDINPDNIKMED